MPSTTVTIIAGVFAFGFFLILGVGLFFAMRRFFRWIYKVLFFKNLKKDPSNIELIKEYIDGSATRFKIEMLLLNEFTDKEVEGLVYAFKKMKKKLKGGFRTNGKSKGEQSIRED
jgi:hypothetical protein